MYGFYMDTNDQNQTNKAEIFKKEQFETLNSPLL